MKQGEYKSLIALLKHKLFDLESHMAHEMLVMSCYIGNVQMVKLITRRGNGPECVCKETGYSGLMIAYSLGFLPLLNFLLEQYSNKMLN